MSIITVCLLLLALACDPGYCVLKLSTYFGDHMVLQRRPQQAVLWGTADTEGDTVTVKVIGQGSDTATVTTAAKNGRWKVKLPAKTAKGPIHHRYKQDVAERLVLGALNVAYGHKDVVFQGPFPTDLTLSTQNTLDIEYDHGQVELTINNNQGFEVCCSESGGSKCDEAHDKWVAAPINGRRTGHVTLNNIRLWSP